MQNRTHLIAIALCTSILLPSRLNSAEPRLDQAPSDQTVKRRTFHGWKANPMVLDKEDPLWKQAFEEVSGNIKTSARTVEWNGPLVIRQGDPKQKLIALTFDDGPHSNFTPRLLALLKQQDIKATFFVIGKMAAKRQGIIRQIGADGHLIGNHTFSHVTLTKLTGEEVQTEYRATNNLLEGILGKEIRFCRPPGGDSDKEVLKAAKAEGMTTVLWTDDPGDYANPGVDVIKKKAIDRLSSGGILLLHDGVEQTLQALPDIIAYAKKQGYKFVTVDQLMKKAESPVKLKPAS